MCKLAQNSITSLKSWLNIHSQKLPSLWKLRKIMTQDYENYWHFWTKFVLHYMLSPRQKSIFWWGYSLFEILLPWNSEVKIERPQGFSLMGFIRLFTLNPATLKCFKIQLLYSVFTVSYLSFSCQCKIIITTLLGLYLAGLSGFYWIFYHWLWVFKLFIDAYGFGQIVCTAYDGVFH